MLHNGSDTYANFFLILSTIKMKLGQILVCCMTSISNKFLAQCRRVETSPRTIFNCPLFTFSKKWNTGIFTQPVIAKLKRTWNLSPVLQIVQKIPENYCPCLYLLVSQVWWLNELWFKQYIQKWTLFHVLIIIVTSQIW